MSQTRARLCMFSRVGHGKGMTTPNRSAMNNGNLDQGKLTARRCNSPLTSLAEITSDWRLPASVGEFPYNLLLFTASCSSVLIMANVDITQRNATL